MGTVFSNVTTPQTTRNLMMIGLITQSSSGRIQPHNNPVLHLVSLIKITWIKTEHSFDTFLSYGGAASEQPWPQAQHNSLSPGAYGLDTIAPPG